MPNAQGEFIWFELLTTEPDAAQAFYSDVMGWTVASAGMEGMDYRIITAPDGQQVGGLMKMPDGMAGGPTWLGYVGVDDVDRSVAGITAAGGAVLMPAMSIPDVGRIAMVADPHGVPFYVMRGASDARSNAFMQGDASVGHCVWAELSSPDPAAAITFYGDMFGWRQKGAMPMGPLGDYQFLHAGEINLGAVMPVVPGGAKAWQYYFHVPDIDDAASRLAAGGGMILQEPMAIPGGGFSLVAQDPQGARVGLVGKRKV
ncbi:VOC family protein [Humitalea sp. 24SJ18S-53]|uniref:VOC family protein n=1 Tax=Humitalea sp. 24SJ18S-53 TaxID=3422307 RepID=UPI003D6757D7